MIFCILKKISREIFHFYYKVIFGALGRKSYILSPLHIDSPQNIFLGNQVIIREFTWLAAVPLTGEKNVSLTIGDNSIIGHFNHIYATKKIVIEENVLTADKVYISDNLHGYKDIYTPIKDQPIQQNNEVIIGRGTWIGEHACILGVKIGKQCVIAANSVVTKDVPDFCVVAGVPAKIIKRFCKESQEWRRTNSSGKFIN